MRRTAISLAVAATLTATACGPPPTSGGGDVATKENLPDCPLDALDKANGKVRVVLWHSEPSVSGETLNQLVKKYNASQDKVTVVAQQQGIPDELFVKYKNAIPTNQLPDLVQFDETRLLDVVNSGTLLPAESCMKASGFDIGSIDSGLRGYYDVNGLFWPAYHSTSQPLLFYNRAHFEKAGLDPDDPPGTLDEIYEASKALKKAGVSKKPFGIDLGRWWFEVWLAGADEDLVNNDNGRNGPATKSLYDNPATHEIYEWLDKMNDEGLLFPVNVGSFDHALGLTNDTTTMLPGPTGLITTAIDFLGGEEAAKSNPDLQPAFAPYPGVKAPGRTQLAGWGYYLVSRSSPEVQAAAWDFMEFMLQPDQGAAWQTQASMLPFQESVAKHRGVKEFYKTSLAGGAFQQGRKQHAAVDPKHPGPLIGPYVAFTEAVQKSLEEMIFAGMSPDDAIAQADAEFQEALDRYHGEG